MIPTGAAALAGLSSHKLADLLALTMRSYNVRSLRGPQTDTDIGVDPMPPDDAVALIAAALTGVPPEQRGHVLAEILPVYVLAWHRLCPDMQAQEIARRYSADVRAALARLAEEAEAPAPRLQ